MGTVFLGPWSETPYANHIPISHQKEFHAQGKEAQMEKDAATLETEIGVATLEIDIDKDDRISVDENEVWYKVSTSITEKIDELFPTSAACCIYRVPQKLRKANEDAYTPQSVSIGPLHRDRTPLQGTEEIKLRYVASFLKRTMADLAGCAARIKSLEENARQHYQENVNLSSGEFIEMLLVDGIFIIELFIRNSFPEYRDYNDSIFDKQWMSSDILHDIILLENQLPLFILHEIYAFLQGHSWTKLSIIDLSFEYIKYIVNIDSLPEQIQVRHLVDFIRALHLPSISRSPPRAKGKLTYTRSATELHEAGVKFKKGVGRLLDIKFCKGVLQIPPIAVHEWTESLFRNIIAFEQCHHEYKFISSYAIFMNSLVKTPADVDLLVNCEIIENSLDDSENVAILFSNLYKETITDHNMFYFSRLCEDLNAYSRTYWHQWKATWFNWKKILLHNYFGNPWATISLMAAVILLILTCIQAVCSIISL